ncbi:hypothetical protein [Bradyrhizobium roseum]|nr:hypothetical protein [Bradyrhizobium roseus]WKA30917.1 hypothetical protein QUH67_12375 [Bradyrhizobium roseus]
MALPLVLVHVGRNVFYAAKAAEMESPYALHNKARIAFAADA